MNNFRSCISTILLFDDCFCHAPLACAYTQAVHSPSRSFPFFMINVRSSKSTCPNRNRLLGSTYNHALISFAWIYLNPLFFSQNSPELLLVRSLRFPLPLLSPNTPSLPLWIFLSLPPPFSLILSWRVFTFLGRRFFSRHHCLSPSPPFLFLLPLFLPSCNGVFGCRSKVSFSHSSSSPFS